MLKKIKQNVDAAQRIDSNWLKGLFQWRINKNYVYSSLNILFLLLPGVIFYCPPPARRSKHNDLYQQRCTWRLLPSGSVRSTQPKPILLRDSYRDISRIFYRFDNLFIHIDVWYFPKDNFPNDNFPIVTTSQLSNFPKVRLGLLRAERFVWNMLGAKR